MIRKGRGSKDTTRGSDLFLSHRSVPELEKETEVSKVPVECLTHETTTVLNGI